MNNKTQWSIKNRLLLLTLLPALSIALLLSIILSATYVNDLDQLAKDQGTLTALQLSSIGSFAINSHDKALQQSLLNSALESSYVRAISLFDEKRQLIAHAGPKMLSLTVLNAEKNNDSFNESLTIQSAADSYRFTTPIIQGNLISSANLAGASSSPQLLGWLEVEITTTHIALKQYQTLLMSVLISVFAVFICGLIALKMSGNILHPLMVISNGIEKIKDGKLDTRIAIDDVAGMSLLASGVNSMASALQTAHEEMQQSIDQATEDLRETLETIEIQNIELDLARKEAIEASRIKSEFLANTSHEIRTPLNGIVGFTNLLLKGHLTGRQREYLTTIQQSSENLLSIINDILDFSKIEAGKLLLDHIPMNLRDVIEESLHLLAPSAHEKKLELIQFIYSDVPTHLVGDPLRLKQVLTNLIINAIKFTSKGNIIVRVMLENIKDQYAIITTSITDEGIGLDDEQRKELFKAFSQADASTSREFGGTGLGLAICKRLVEQMGGDIGLDSTPNEGSTFWFTIKAEIEDQDESKLAQLSGRSILFCEPNAMTQTSISHLFEEWQLHTESCNDYRVILDKVIARADTNPYETVVIGLEADKTSAEEISAIVRELDEIHDCGTIILSSTSIKDRLEDAVESYVAICLAKPASHYKLYDALCALMLRKVKPTGPQQLRTRPRDTEIQQTPLKVLAVDDNAANLKLVTTLLTDLGAEVFQANGGEEAIHLFQHELFDIVFMDIQMPGMDGVEATKCMRAIEAGAYRTPIVALTAHALIEEKRRLIDSGLDDHLAKPLSENSLNRTLQKWCHRDGTRQPTKQQSIIKEMDEITDNLLALDIENTSAIDRELSLKLSNGKVDLAKDMLRMLLNSLEQDQSAINASFQAHDYEALLEKIHRLHGATCYCGVPNLKNITSTAESMIKQAQWNQLGLIMKELNDEIAALRDWNETQNVDEFFAQSAELSRPLN